MKKKCINNIAIILWSLILVLYFLSENSLVDFIINSSDKTTDIGSADKIEFIRNQYKLILASVVISVGILILIVRSNIEFKDNQIVFALYDIVLSIVFGVLAGSWLYEALITYPQQYGI